MHSLMELNHVHVCVKGRQGFIEIVHLGENTDCHDNDKDVCRGMNELVVSAKRELQRDTKGLDRHD